MALDLTKEFPIRVLTPAKDMQTWKDRGITAVEGPPRGDFMMPWCLEAQRLGLQIWLRGNTNVENVAVRCGPDEPDLPRKNLDVAKLAALMEPMTRPRFLNFSGDLKQQLESNYRGMMGHAEIISGDVYPINQAAKARPLGAQVEMLRKLREWSGEKPCGAYIECAYFGLDPAGRAPTPAEMRAQVWLAVIGGARTIGWFPHQLKPAWKWDAMPLSNVAEMITLNASLKVMAPILQGPIDPVPLMSSHPDVFVGSRLHKGELHVFAVNAAPTKLINVFVAVGDEVPQIGPWTFPPFAVEHFVFQKPHEWLRSNSLPILDAIWAEGDGWQLRESITDRVTEALR